MCAVREGKIQNTSLPVIEGNFATNKFITSGYRKGSLTFDSGAARSYLHESHLEYLRHERASPITREYYGAGGTKLKVRKHYYNVWILLEYVGEVCFKEALISTEREPFRGMLVGRTDMSRLKVEINFGRDTLGITNSKDGKRGGGRTWIFDMVKGNRSSAYHENFIGGLGARDDPENILDDHQVNSDDRSSTCGLWGDPCRACEPDENDCDQCEVCIDRDLKEENEKEFRCPSKDPDFKGDVRAALNRTLERIRQSDRETFTHLEAKINPEGAKRYPKAAKAIPVLLEKYKRVFAKDTGKVPDEYAVGGTIVGNVSKMRAGTGQSFEGITHHAVVKQLLRQAAHGVIKPCMENGIIPKNIMRIVPVKKKTEDGKEIKAMTSIRIAINAQETNARTDFRGVPTDKISQSLDFAANVSRAGLTFKCDFTECYHEVPIQDGLKPYFCIAVPGMGIWYYDRVMQGWVKAAQDVQEVLTKIFWQVRGYYWKYMDDVLLGSDINEDHYLVVLEKFLSLCESNNLRLKGSKCEFLAFEFDFLGYRISAGTIGPNPHKLNKLLEVELECLSTKTKMKSFLGGVKFLAKFMKRSAHFLKPLEDACRGDGAEKIEYNEILSEAFARVKKALTELTNVHPFNPDLPTIIVVDTSLYQTGGFIYQTEGKENKIIGFYSRTRKNIERKIPLSSCHFEIVGALTLVMAYMSTLSLARNTITLFTDSASFVKIWTRFKQNKDLGNDTTINTAIYQMATRLDLNVQHLKNTTGLIGLSDLLSRLDEVTGAKEMDPCDGTNCSVCNTAEMLDDMPHERVIKQVSSELRSAEMFDGILRADQGERKFDKDCLVARIQDKEREIAEERSWNALKKTRYRIETLLADKRALVKMQDRDKDLRKIIKGLRNGTVSYPKKEDRLQRVVEEFDPRLKDGVLTYKETVDGNECRVIPLPPAAAPIAVAAVHETVGHRSITQLVKMLRRYFKVLKPREVVSAFVDNCIRCTLQRGGGNFARVQMKPVPIPNEFYQTILMDEMTRNYNNGKDAIKVMVAMEGLSQFITVMTYEGSMNSELFLAMLAHVKSILCPHGLDNVKINLRVDGAKYHTSAMAREALERMNVELEVHESKSLSKNSLPELDVKMKLFGIELGNAIEGDGVPAEVAAHIAAAKCNSTIGENGASPAEIFTGRGWRGQKLVRLDARELIESLEKRRAAGRESAARKAALKKKKEEAELVPYEDPDLNQQDGARENSKMIRVGDLVTLKVKRDKNELPAAWEVTKLDFTKKEFLAARRSGVESGTAKEKWFSFEIIDKIFPKETDILSVESKVKHGGELRKFLARVATLAATNIRSQVTIPKKLEFIDPNLDLSKLNARTFEIVDLPPEVKLEPEEEETVSKKKATERAPPKLKKSKKSKSAIGESVRKSGRKSQPPDRFGEAIEDPERKDLSKEMMEAEREDRLEQLAQPKTRETTASRWTFW